LDHGTLLSPHSRPPWGVFTDAMSTSTIEITEGITERTSRLALKKTMLPFGQVDACHMGDRAVMGDRFTEFPIVRFKLQSSAEAALQALKSGQVFLDGYQLRGEWRGGGGQAVRQRKAHAPPPDLTAQPFEETSSRMLLDTPTQGGSGRNTFAGRDQRRNDREELSSRDLFDAPANPRRSRSRRQSHGRRSRSRRRKHSRSGSHGKKNASKVTSLAVFRLSESAECGNLEGAVSDNPLFRGGR